MSRVKYTKPPKDEWDSRTNMVVPRKVKTIPFAEELENILPYNSKLTCLEVGAIPGSFLIYLKKEFGYDITGIDFSKNINKFTDTMSVNGVKKYKFINDDFFKHKFKNNFDVVCSFGFIEHFDDVEGVVERHCDLVASNGFLVLEVPNFRHLQFIYHYIFDRDNLKIHNTKAMKPKFVGDIIAKKGFEKVYSGYVGGVEIWNDVEPSRNFMRKLNNRLKAIINKRKGKVNNSRLYSPMLLMVYKKS